MSDGDEPLEKYRLCPTQHIVNISTLLRQLISNSLPIGIVLEKRCLRFINWPCIIILTLELTPSLHRAYTELTPSLHRAYTELTPSLHRAYTELTPSLHRAYTELTPSLHRAYTELTPSLHRAYTELTPSLHRAYTELTPSLGTLDLG